MNTPPGTRLSVTAPEDQSATFVELFFDLVFVFAVTQVVGLLHGGTWTGAGQAVLAFWLVWWAWTQFTWTLNASNTTHPWIEFGTLLATAAAFFMAIALPNAFHERALDFAVAYTTVRLIGLAFQLWVTWETPSQRAAVKTFALVSLGGLAAVLVGGFMGAAALLWFWGLAIVLDVVAALAGGRAEGWNLHAEHFAERHGLFVIIALGETLIVAAGGVSGERWSPELIAGAGAVVVLTCGLWWSYFTRAKPVLEHALASRSGTLKSRLARDAFSLLHFPMMCGVIAYAFATEEAVAHLGEPLAWAGRLALGLTLFAGGTALAVWWATRRVLLTRLTLLAGTAATVLMMATASAWLTVVVAATGVTLIALSEQSWGGAADAH